MKKILLIASFLLVAAIGHATNLDQIKAYRDFQNDADIIRLRHLKYYGTLIEKYYAKTGTYPFMDEAQVPVYVYVALPKQLESITQKPPYKHKRRSFAEFINLIESKLETTVDEYYDPQYGADYKPNFYVYKVVNNTYFFSIHQHNTYPFSKPIAKYYNKIEISNKPTPSNKAISPKTLFSDNEFIAQLDKPVKKEEFFLERQRKHLHQTKGRTHNDLIRKIVPKGRNAP